jgi:hypothetical protein
VLCSFEKYYEFEVQVKYLKDTVGNSRKIEHEIEIVETNVNQREEFLIRHRNATPRE